MTVIVTRSTLSRSTLSRAALLRLAPLLAALAIAAPVQAQQPGLPVLDPARGVLTFAPSLQMALPAVVQIQSLERAGGGALQVGGTGSGAIIDAGAGLILTNQHVVEGSEALRAVLEDGRILDAELLGADEATDTAVLRIAAEGLAQIPAGDSDTVQVGDVVFAIGYPFGLAQTVTMGIVSGLGRSNGADAIEDFIQTDAPINFGNSGGPLINSRGELIGVNTAIYSPGGREGGNVGIGFVTPARIALAIADQIVRTGQVQRGRIGIAMQEMTPELAESLGLPHPQGVIVRRVEDGSPAAQAGLESGDVILTANGREILSPATLRAVVGVLEPGREVTLQLRRAARELSVTVTLDGSGAAARPAGGTSSGAQAAPLPGLPEGGLQAFGASFRDSRAEDRLPGDLKGAVVAALASGAGGGDMGLMPGDAIIALNDRPVTSAAALVAMVQGGSGSFRASVVRPGVNAVIPMLLDN